MLMQPVNKSTECLVSQSEPDHRARKNEQKTFNSEAITEERSNINPVISISLC